MKLYELNYLISPDLSEEGLTAFQEKINNWIREEKGVLGEIYRPIKKNLAYPIKKGVQAYLGSVNFHLDSDRLANIEKKLKAEENIIRYLVLGKKPKKLTARRLRKPIKRLGTPLIKTEVPKKEKAELENIEQKLEEILKET